MDAEKLLGVLSDSELNALFSAAPAELERRGMEVPVIAGTVAVSEAVESITLSTSPEQAPLSPESLLEGFDQAYQTYGFVLDATNSARAEAKGRKKPAQLETVSADDIRTDVEALLANEDVIAELQAEVDHFVANPEADSPAPGFDLVIVPEGLTASDEQAVAEGVQAKITTDYTPYIRPEAYNDKRTPEVTGKGYRIAFAPRHYNVPKGTAAEQTKWLTAYNQQTAATELQTATDAEALAYINGLADTGALDNPSTRFDQTYFRRSDQAPHDGCVSVVCVFGDGGLFLDGSDVRNVDPARALVVPKA